MRIQEPNVERLRGRKIEAETHGVCGGHRHGGSQVTGGWQLLAATRRGAAYETPDRASSFRSFPSDVPPRWRFLSEARCYDTNRAADVCAHIVWSQNSSCSCR